MVNVDGVICGNSRTSLSGCDLNRRWINPDEYIHPEIYYLKELITNFKKSVNIEYIIDFHGHFGIFNSFFYGNNDNSKIKYCKYFPFVCGRISDIILFGKSSFAMPRSKNGTARINLFDEISQRITGEAANIPHIEESASTGSPRRMYLLKWYKEVV